MKASIIKTERLILKPLSLLHVSNNYLNWLNDPIVNEYITNSGNYTLKKLKSFLKDIENKDIYFWAIHLINDNKHIGNIKIDPINTKHGLGQYGIMMGDRSEWNKGYAKESSLAVINYCFNTLNLRKITLEVIVDNNSAYQLYKKLGFVEEGLRKDQEFHNKSYYDSCIMALFNSNFNYEN